MKIGMHIILCVHAVHMDTNASKGNLQETLVRAFSLQVFIGSSNLLLFVNGTLLTHNIAKESSFPQPDQIKCKWIRSFAVATPTE